MLRAHNLCCRSINTWKWGLHKCSSYSTHLTCLNVGQVGKSKKEQFARDIPCKDKAMDYTKWLTAPDDEPKHHMRKASKKTKIIVWKMWLHRDELRCRHIQRFRVFPSKKQLIISAAPPPRKGGEIERKYYNGYKDVAQRERELEQAT